VGLGQKKKRKKLGRIRNGKRIRILSQNLPSDFSISPLLSLLPRSSPFRVSEGNRERKEQEEERQEKEEKKREMKKKEKLSKYN
jgi:hypothetical protein